MSEQQPKFTSIGPVPASDRVRVEKGWGYEDWIWNRGGYCGKILFFKRDRQCSYHYHRVKDEVFYCEFGRVRIQYGWQDDCLDMKEHVMSPGSVFHVPPGMRHRVIAVEDAYLFEFSTTHWDDDSIRVIKGD